MTALLPSLAFAAVFTAGMFARSLWEHERAVFRRARGSRTAAVAPLPALNYSEAWGPLPTRSTDEVARDLNDLADTLILAKP